MRRREENMRRSSLAQRLPGAALVALTLLCVAACAHEAADPLAASGGTGAAPEAEAPLRSGAASGCEGAGCGAYANASASQRCASLDGSCARFGDAAGQQPRPLGWAWQPIYGDEEGTCEGEGGCRCEHMEDSAGMCLWEDAWEAPGVPKGAPAAQEWGQPAPDGGECGGEPGACVKPGARSPPRASDTPPCTGARAAASALLFAADSAPSLIPRAAKMSATENVIALDEYKKNVVEMLEQVRENTALHVHVFVV